MPKKEDPPILVFRVLSALFLIQVFSLGSSFAQTGPAGVGDKTGGSNLVFWFLGDSIPGSDGADVTNWPDLSGRGNDLSQANVTFTPILRDNVINGRSVAEMSKSNDRIVRNPVSGMPTNAITSIMVYRSTDVGSALISYNASGQENEYLLFDQTDLQTFINGSSLPSGQNTTSSDFQILTHRWRSSDGRNQLIQDNAIISNNTQETGSTIGGGGSLALAGEQDGVNTGYTENQNFDGDIAEVIIFNTYLDSAQLLAVNNYLSTQYNITIANDFYAFDGTHNAELGGILQVASDIQNTANSSSLLNINSPTGLSSGENLFFAHDNGNTVWTTAEAPSSGVNIRRIAREWRVDEDGDVGTVTVQLDTTGLEARPGTAYSRFALMVDDDGDFSSGAQVYELNSLGGSLYDVDVNLTSGQYLSFATIIPTLSFDNNQLADSEVNDPTINVRLNYITLTAVTFNYETNDTAPVGATADASLPFDAAADYLSIPSTIGTILAGSSSTSFTLDVNQDSNIAGEEGDSLRIDLSNPSAGDITFLFDRLVFSINDDDNPRKVYFDQATSSIDEFGGSIEVTVNITPSQVDPTNPTTVNYVVNTAPVGGSTATGGGIDYTLANGTLNIPANFIAGTISIPIVDDVLDEANETIIIDLNSPTNGSLSGTEPIRHTVTIIDNEDPPTVQFNVTSASGAENTSPSISITISAESGSDVSVDYVVSGTAEGGSVDYNFSSAGTATISAGSLFTNLSPTILDDAEFESPESLVITLRNPSGATLAADSIFTYIIEDNEGAFGFSGPGGIASNDGTSPLELWLIGDSVTAANGATFNSWNDESGNAIVLGSSADASTVDPTFRTALATINDHDYVDFAASEAVLITPGSNFDGLAGRQFTVYSVLRDPENGADHIAPIQYERDGDTNEFLIFHRTSYGAELFVDANQDNAPGRSDASIDDGNWRIFSSRWRSVDGQIQYYSSGDSLRTANLLGGGVIDGGGTLSVGHEQDGEDNYNEVEQDFDGDLAELLIFTSYLSETRRILVDNYLSTKYGISLSNDDYFNEASVGAAYEVELAGIGREGEADVHDDAQSAGSLRINNASSLDIGDYLLFAHDNGALTYSTSELPVGADSLQRVAREWGVDETGEVGTVTVRLTNPAVSLGGIPANTTGYVLLVDDDGDFSNGGTSSYTMTASGSDFVATGVDLSDSYITFAALGIKANFNVTSSSVNEGGTSINVEVSLSQAPTSGTVTVFYNAESGSTATAGPGQDYEFNVGTASPLSFGVGVQTQNITVDINDDTDNEVAETVIIELLSATNATVGSDTLHTLTIVDNDALRGGSTGPGGIRRAAALEAWWHADSAAFSDAGITVSTDGGSVVQWNDLSGSAQNHNATAINASFAPTYNLSTSLVNGMQAIDFSGSDSLLTISNETGINDGGPFGAKSIALAFETGSNVSTRQVVYEQGGGTNGINVRVESNQIVVAIWDNDWTDVTNGYYQFTGPASANTVNIVALEFRGLSQSIRASINGVILSPAIILASGGNDLDDHGGDVGFGGITGSTRTDVDSPGSGEYFSGKIMQVLNLNDSLNSAETVIVGNYLAAKYNANFGANSIYGYATTHPHGVIGIGQVNGEFHLGSTSDSLLTITNPSAIGNGDFIMLGHDNAGSLAFSGTETPDSTIERLSREYRVTKTNDLGSVLITIDTTALPGPNTGFTNYALLVDADGDFSSGAQVFPMTRAGGTDWSATIDFTDGDYFTIATIEPVVYFASASINQSEGNTPANIEVRLNYPIVDNVTVNFDTTAVTSAINTEDITYPALPSSVVINAGDTSAIIGFTILDDMILESADDTVQTQITGATNALIGMRDINTLLINDNDNSQEIDFSVSSATVAEGAGVVNAILRLNSVNASANTTVNYTVSGASSATESADFTLTNGTAQIDQNQLTTNLTIPIIDDLSDEDPETIIIELSGPVNAALGINTQFTITVNDNDAEPSLNFTNTNFSSAESTSLANFSVGVSQVSGKTITVDYAIVAPNTTASGASDYTLSSGILTIPAGVTSQNIVATITDDVEEEVDETLQIRISDEGNLLNAVIGAADTATYIIEDNDNGGFRGPGGILEPNGYEFWLRSDKLVQRDTITGALAGNGARVQRWVDFSTNGNNAKGITGDEPFYLLNAVNGKPSLEFNSVDSALVIDNAPGINDGNGPYNTRTIVAAFQAGTDVLTQQVVYEEGGGTNGFVVFVEDDSVFVGAWAESASVPWAFDTVGTAITAGQTMVAVLEFSVSDGGRLTGYFNADSVGTKTGKNEGVPNHGGGVSIGGSDDGWNFGSGDFFTGEVMEIMLLNNLLSSSERIIIENYLGSKYGADLTTSGNDFFAHDVVHGYDVIGIGRENINDFHIQSQSDSLVTLSNASNLDVGEYFFLGNDNASVSSYVTTESPGTQLERLRREWRVTETGNVGSVTISIDTVRLGISPSTGFTEHVLLVDADGIFTSGATILPMAQVGNGFEVTTDLANGDYFTFAVFRPGVEFSNTTSNFSETVTSGSIAVSLNYPLVQDFTFTATETGGGTATENTDFTFTDGVVTIPAGTTSTNLTLNVVNDSQVESDETVIIQLTNPSKGIVGSNATHTYTINDDDNFRKANFARSDSTNTEDQAPIQIGVFLNAANTSGPTEIFYSVSGGSAINDSTDFFVQAVDTLRFPTAPASGDTLQFININVIDDLLDEDPETVIISLIGGSGATIGDTTVFTYTIGDNDAPPTVSFTTASRSGAESAQTVDLAIELSQASGKDIVVPFSSTDISTTLNADYQLPSSAVTIFAGNTTDSIQFVVLNDGQFEANEQLSINIGSPTNATIGANPSLTYTILDDDGLGFRGPGGIGNLDEQVALWLRATDPGFGLSNGDAVANIQDRTNNGNNGFQATGANQPQYLTNNWNSRPVFSFDGNDLIELNDSDQINTGGPYDQKTIMVSFRTSSDVTTRQMIYEEGGGVRGLSIYIDNGFLYIGGWNNNDDDGGATTPWPAPGPPTNYTVFSTRPVSANSNNYVFLQFDFLAGTGTIDGDVRAAVNGEALVPVTGAGRLFNHPGDIGIGGINEGTVVHDGNEGIVQNYNGNIGEVVVQNLVYNPAQYVIVNNYLATKYNVPLTSVQDVFAYDVNYSYELFGIGQVNDSSHTDAQGQGIVRILNPNDLDNNEFLIAGHDNGGVSSWTPTGVPDGDVANFRRLPRTWRVDETGDVGTVTVRLEATNLPPPPVGFIANYVLLVDDDNDFSTDATAYQLVSNSGYFEVQNINIPTDGYFTFGLANPVLGFTSATADGAENVAPTSLQVTLNYVTQNLVTVDIDTTVNSTAQPADFNLTGTSVSITSGNQTANLPLTIVNDSDEETTENIQLVISNPSTGMISAADTAVYDILDDDIGRRIQFILADSTGQEADSPALIRVFTDSLSTTDSLRVYYEVVGGTATAGSDFVLAADSLKWPLFGDNPNDTIRSISLTINQDLLDETTETIQIRLSSPFQAGLGTQRDFTYNITDDDVTPSVDWLSTTGSGPETSTSVLAIVSLSAASGQDITVNYSDQSTDPPTPGGIDYDLQGSSIIIPAGQTQDTITFSVFDDAIANEGAEDVVIRIDGAVNATVTGTPIFTYTILDDESGFGPLGPGGIGDEDEIAFWLRGDAQVFSDLGTTAAADGADVRQWNDQGGNANNAIEGTTTSGDSIPSFIATAAAANNQSGLRFENANFEFLTIADNNLINNNANDYTQKSMTLVFETGGTDPPATNQIIYEQGGGGNGFNVYHGTDGDLHFGAWSTGSTPSWGYTEVTAPVAANQLVMAIFEIDASNGNLNVYIDGNAVSTTATGVSSVLNSHGGDIGIGATINDTRFSTGTINGDGNFFNGRIFELAQFNERNLNIPARRILRNYYSTKYGIAIGAEDLYAYDALYANELIGIGSQSSELHVASQGSGLLRLDNPLSIDDGDYTLVGHDAGGVSSFSTANTPAGFGNRFMERVSRVWRVDETGDLGVMRISVDTSRIGTLPTGFTELFLMVGTSPVFTTFDSLVRLDETFGNTLRASYDFTDGQFFTIAAVQNVSAQPGPWNDPATWTIGIPALNETAFLKDSVYLTADVTASVVVALDNMAGRGKLNLNSHTLNVRDSLIILGFGMPNQDSTTFTAGTGTVNYGGPGTEIFIQPLVYYNLTISGQGRRHLRSETVIQNDFTIDDNPQLLTNGNNMQIRGDWNSAINATFTPGGGTVMFNGSGPQRISPTNQRITFDNLMIQNTGGDVTLGDSVEVMNVLTLSQNDLILENEVLIISNTASGAIVSPGDNTSYIQADGNGTVRRSVIAGTTYTYPVGDASGDYSPFTFTPTTLTGTSPTVEVNLRDGRFNDIDDGRAHVSRYWSFNQSGVASATFDITMQYTDADVAGGSEADLVPIKFSTDADTSDFPSYSLNVGANTMTWQGLTSFSIVTMGGTAVTTPVELLYFSGKQENTNILLQWATAVEISNEGFEIEWATETGGFETIGFVEGNGDTEEIVEYEFTDYEPVPGINYYRLRQIDYDGMFEYSPIIPVEFTAFERVFEVAVFPNPSTADNVNVSIETGNLAQPIQMQLFDMLGRVVHEEQVEVIDTRSSHQLKLSPELVRRGTYILRVHQQGADLQTKRVLIK